MAVVVGTDRRRARRRRRVGRARVARVDAVRPEEGRSERPVAADLVGPLVRHRWWRQGPVHAGARRRQDHAAGRRRLGAHRRRDRAHVGRAQRDLTPLGGRGARPPDRRPDLAADVDPRPRARRRPRGIDLDGVAGGRDRLRCGARPSRARRGRTRVHQRLHPRRRCVGLVDVADGVAPHPPQHRTDRDRATLAVRRSGGARRGGVELSRSDSGRHAVLGPDARRPAAVGHRASRRDRLPRSRRRAGDARVQPPG